MTKPKWLTAQARLVLSKLLRPLRHAPEAKPVAMPNNQNAKKALTRMVRVIDRVDMINTPVGQ